MIKFHHVYFFSTTENVTAFKVLFIDHQYLLATNKTNTAYVLLTRVLLCNTCKNSATTPYTSCYIVGYIQKKSLHSGIHNRSYMLYKFIQYIYLYKRYKIFDVCHCPLLSLQHNLHASVCHIYSWSTLFLRLPTHCPHTFQNT